MFLETDHSRCHGSSAVGRLPLRGKNIVPVEFRSKVLAKLGDSNDGASRLVVKTGENEDIDGVDTPRECPRLVLDSLKYGLLVVLRSCGVSDLLDMLALGVGNVIFVDHVGRRMRLEVVLAHG